MISRSSYSHLRFGDTIDGGDSAILIADVWQLTVRELEEETLVVTVDALLIEISLSIVDAKDEVLVVEIVNTELLLFRKRAELALDNAGQSPGALLGEGRDEL